MKRVSISIIILLATTVSSAALAQQVTDSTQGPGTALGYGDVTYSSTWDRVANKPDHFPSRWQDVQGKPATAERWPKFSEVTDKPNSFPSKWSDISGKPSSYPSSWNNISGKPSKFPSKWSDISGKPSRFPAKWSDISGKPRRFPSKWDDISGIPAAVKGGTATLDERYARKDEGMSLPKGVMVGGYVTVNSPMGAGTIGGGGTSLQGCWGDASCDSTPKCPSGTKTEGYNMVEQISWTTTGCDGGCNHSGLKTTTYTFCTTK